MKIKLTDDQAAHIIRKSLRRSRASLMMLVTAPKEATVLDGDEEQLIKSMTEVIDYYSVFK